MQETQVRFLGQEDLWRGEWQPTLVFLPGKFHGQRSLAGCSPWGHKESDMTDEQSTQGNSQNKTSNILFLGDLVGTESL
ncbi:hypothetical protein DVA69_17305 [Acinetobacter baumannii]|nr:hypothetical protein DVA69_17305 [Acinetobacter baumannii]